ncbi:MAG: hypothetical protein J6I73_00430 [Treponema sp.]|nr:hypothetical protein [Treponema sp.]
MKTVKIAVAMIVACAVPLFADGTGISLAGIWRGDSVKTGGTVEVGFPFVEKNLIIRDYVTLNGYGGKVNELSFGELSIGDKLQIGGRVDCGTFHIVPYGFVNAEFGIYRTSAKKFFEAPFILDIGGGGGFEIRYLVMQMPMQSFFIEFGGGGMLMPGKPAGGFSAGYASLAIGYRTYF